MLVTHCLLPLEKIRPRLDEDSEDGQGRIFDKSDKR
jgi:hypothetical protein